MPAVENLVQVIRSDADQRKKLVCKACFLSALASVAPGVVKNPRATRRWRRGELAAVAAATVARLEGRDKMHCIVGTDEFNANLRYARGSLVYLRADTNPPLRVLLYASLPPPRAAAALKPLPSSAAVEETTTKQGTDKRQGGLKVVDDDDAADADADDAVGAAVDAKGAARLVDACNASPELIAAVLEALACDPPATSAESAGDRREKAAAERAAAWRGTRLRDSLTATYGPFWHVVHSALAFGACVHESAPGRQVIVRRGRHEYIVWHHVATSRGVLEGFAKGVKWSAVLRAARYLFLAVVAAYVLWFRAMCVDEEGGGGGGGGGGDTVGVEGGTAGVKDEAEAEEGATGVGAGFDDRAAGIEASSKAAAARVAARTAAKAAARLPPLTMLEPSLTRWGCKAGPAMAPVAVTLLTIMFVSGSGVFQRIGHRMAAQPTKRL